MAPHRHSRRSSQYALPARMTGAVWISSRHASQHRTCVASVSAYAGTGTYVIWHAVIAVLQQYFRKRFRAETVEFSHPVIGTLLARGYEPMQGHSH